MKLLFSTILLAVATVAAAVLPSTAVFTSTSGNAQTVAAAADWTPPQPTLTAPAGPWRGNVTVQATATDDVSGVASVTVQSRRAGTTDWTTRCTLTPPATACVLSSATLGDGIHDLRATATDVAGNTGASAVQQRTVDTTAPLVTLTDPGALLSGTVILQATATDATTSVATVRFQSSPAGSGQWTDRCTASADPYRCVLDTTTLANGAYDLRAIATDAAGNVATHVVTNRRVDNSPLAVTIANLPDVVRGTTSVTAQVVSSGTSTVTVVIERRVAGTNNFTTLCTTSVAPYQCSWNTTAVADGDWELRARATSATASATSAIADTQVDNTSPTVTVQDPGATLSGDVTIRATAADPHPTTVGVLGSGVANVQIEVAPWGTSAWTPLCVDTTSPYTCSFPSTTVPDGAYQFRAIATDVAGNVTISGVVGPRTVDNTVSSVSLVDVPETLRGTEALRATASSTAGVTQVTIERRTPGAATWTPICTDTTSPYTCTFDTRTVVDGAIELRAVLLDGAGRTLISEVVTRTVDNAPVRGLDVQAFNVPGGTSGRVEAGDRIEFSYNRPMAPGSFVAGWDGRARSVGIRLRHRNQFADTVGGSGSGVDVFTTTQLTQAVPVGLVRTGQDHVGPNQSLTFAGSMTLVTEEVDGELRSTIVVTVGALQQGSNANWLRTAQAGTMTWLPSTTPTDVDGVRTAATVVTEQGPVDRDF